MRKKNNKCVYRHRRLDTNEIFYIGMGSEKRANSLKDHNTSLDAAIKREIFIIKNNLKERRIKRNFPDKTLEDLSKWKI